MASRVLQCFICEQNCYECFDEKSDVLITWGSLNSKNHLSVGLSGCFIIQSCPTAIRQKLDTYDGSSEIPYYGTPICIKCLKQCELVPDKSVECAKCKHKFQKIFDEDCRGGWDCNAIVCSDHITGCFGSKFDSMSRSEDCEFIGPRPADLPIDSVICDDCIQKCIDEKICLPPKGFAFLDLNE